jgi:cation-transporting P-type ATPase E
MNRAFLASPAMLSNLEDLAGPVRGALAGLSEAEALTRRARGQGNVAGLSTGRTYAQILRGNVLTFINGVLFGLGLALVLLGRWSDALVSVGVVAINVLVSVVQEVRAKRMLDRIALLTRPTAAVIRDGQERIADPSEVVLGDVLALRPGDQVVVDGVVVGDGRMDMDESLLTGESDLVPKAAGDVLYSGSFCVSGAAMYEATHVGSDSFAGRLTASARAFRRIYTPLQQEINRAVRVILVLAAVMEMLLVVAALVEEIPIIEGIKISVVIAGLVPNGLFLAIALAYAMGALRIARRGALVQQANAVESLSNVDVLCLDKTGTLTSNRIQFHAVHPVGIEESELRRLLGEFSASGSTGNRTSDAIASACGGQPRRVLEEVPFSSARKWSALLVDDEPALRGTYVLGAPELIVPSLVSMDGLAEQADEWTATGLRVLLFAFRSDAAPLHDAAGEPRLPEGLVALGLVSLSDELRADAQQTLAGFAAAGIKLKIISGDNPGTVVALANQAGLATGIRAISGLDLRDLDDAHLSEAVEETTIFGRVTPTQKEQLVRALRDRGHYVAMVGDGVNDVLSLKQAHLGIALHSGSQAARAVADLILLDDRFGVLPEAFREGQRIVNGMSDILKLFMTRILYVAMVILAVAAVQAGFPLAPKHSALFSMFAVGLPTLALAAWARPAAARGSVLGAVFRFALPAACTLALVGFAVYVGYFIVGMHAIPESGPERLPAALAAQAVAQTALTVVSVLCGLLLLVFVEPPTPAWTGGDVLSGDRRPAILAALLLAAFVAMLAVAPLRDAFELSPLAPTDYALLGLVTAAWGLLVRWVWRARLLDRLLSR